MQSTHEQNELSTDKLLNRSEVSALLSVKPDTIKKWQYSGKIKVYCTINGRPRYAKSEILKLMVKN